MRHTIVLASCLLLAACEGTAPTVSIGTTTARLETSPVLLNSLDSFVVAFFNNQTGQSPCVDLLELSVEQLQLRVPVADAPLAKGASDAGHVFGSIRTGGVHSFLVLGVAGTDGAPVTLETAEGKVIALGCEEVDVVQDERDSIAVTLFPVGRR